MLEIKDKKQIFLKKIQEFFKKYNDEYKKDGYTFRPITNDDSDLIEEIYTILQDSIKEGFFNRI